MGSSYGSDNIEGWDCFQMDCEGHLVSFNFYRSNFHLSNESIEHLSTFPHLNNLLITLYPMENEQNIINLSLLSNLRSLSISFDERHQDPELLKDLGLFSNLISLSLSTAGNLSH